MPSSTPKAHLETNELSSLKAALSETFSSCAADLNQIELRMRGVIGSEASTLSEISSYLLELGGKRVRPLIAILCGRYCGGTKLNKELETIAAGIELIHTATLLHDDIIDRSAKRRGKKSAYLEYGMPATLLTGDFLLVRAFGLCGVLDNFVVSATEGACVALTEGEILEQPLTLDRRSSIKEYENVAAKKTASLFGLAACLAAHTEGRSKEEKQAMEAFGLSAGIAFQIVDDILDIVADEDLLGKPSGTDLRQKSPSLLNILWLNSSDEKAKEFFSTEEYSEAQISETIAYLKESSFITEARTMASKHAKDALDSLNLVQNGDAQAKAQLETIVEYTLKRCL